MRSINKVIIIGNLTRDPEMRQTPSGQSVTTFGVATNRTWITKNGEKKSEAEYHEAVAWGNLAEICFKYLKKSKLVYIEGYLKTRSWDTPEGIRRFKTEIVIQDMIMLDKKGSVESEYIPELEDMDEEYSTPVATLITEKKAAEEKSFPSPAPAPAQKETSLPDETPATEEKKRKQESKLSIDDDLGL